MHHNEEHLKRELIGLEKKYWQAMQDQDLQTAIRLTDFPCLVAGAHGLMAVDQAQYEKMFQSHKEEVLRVRVDDNPEVRLLLPDTAIIAYKINCTMKAGGKEKTMNAVDTSTWVKRDGEWRCAMHTETELLAA